MEYSEDRAPKYQKNSLTLIGAVALGTGVMIGAGIFALTGQMAEMTGVLFPLAFLSAALVVSQRLLLCENVECLSFGRWHWHVSLQSLWPLSGDSV